MSHRLLLKQCAGRFRVTKVAVLSAADELRLFDVKLLLSGALCVHAHVVTRHLQHGDTVLRRYSGKAVVACWPRTSFLTFRESKVRDGLGDGIDPDIPLFFRRRTVHPVSNLS